MGAYRGFDFSSAPTRVPWQQPNDDEKDALTPPGTVRAQIQPGAQSPGVNAPPVMNYGAPPPPAPSFGGGPTGNGMNPYAIGPQPNQAPQYSPPPPTPYQQPSMDSGTPGSNPIRNYLMNTIIGQPDRGGTPGVNGQPGTDQGGATGLTGLLGLRRGGFLRRGLRAPGGIVNRPTVAAIGADGPTAVIPLSQPPGAQAAQLQKYQGLARQGENPMPESPATLKLQVDQLAGGQRKLVLFPEGSDIPPRPPGIRQMRTQDGTVFYDPATITPPEIQDASNQGNLGAVLGDRDQGYGAPAKAALRGTPSVVSPEAPDGTPVQDVATDADHLDQTTAAASRLIPRGGRLRIQSPQAAIMNRVRAATIGNGGGDPSSRPTPMQYGGYGDEEGIANEQPPTETENATPPQNWNDPGSPTANLARPDPTDDDVMKRARQIAMGSKEADDRYNALRTAAEAPLQKPSLGRTIGGALIQVLGRGRLDNVAQNVMYPGLMERQRAQQAYENERQYRQEQAGEVGKLDAFGRLQATADWRKSQAQVNKANEQRRFAAGGGTFAPTDTYGGSATFQPPPPDIPQAAAPLPASDMTPPQVTAPGAPPQANGLPPGAQGPPAPPPRQFLPPAQQPVPQVQPPPDMGAVAVQAPPSLPVTIAAKGGIAPPAGATQVQNAPYDAPGFQRYQRDPAQIAKDKVTAQQAGWKALPTDIADYYGFTKDDKFPPADYSKMVGEYSRDQRDANKVTPQTAAQQKIGFQNVLEKIAPTLPAAAMTDSRILSDAIRKSDVLTQPEKNKAIAFLAANPTPATTGTTGVIRMEQLGATREYPVIDTQSPTREMSMRSAAEINASRGRFAPAGQGATALSKGAIFQDLHYNIDSARKAIAELPAMDPGTRAALSYSLRGTDPRSSIQTFLTGAAGTNMTPQQQEAVQALALLAENAMSLRSVAGMGQGSDELRAAILNTIPSGKSPSKDYAQNQLNRFEQVVTRLETGVPGMGNAQRKPAAPAQTPPAANNRAPVAGNFNVTDPQGNVHPFDTQSAADAFRQLANIPAPR